MHFALTTFNRLDILKTSLESLLKSDFPPDSHLIVSDDGSSKDVKDYITESFERTIPNLTVKIFLNKINVGCDLNMFRVIRECLFDTKDKYIVTIDSDAIYNPKWIRKLIEAKSQITDGIEIGMLGVFNTPNHPTIKDYNDSIVIKKSMGGFTVMLNRDIFLYRTLSAISWDWSYVGLCNKFKCGIFCTKKSYADHIGTVGFHTTSTSFDRAKDFIPEGD